MRKQTTQSQNLQLGRSIRGSSTTMDFSGLQNYTGTELLDLITEADRVKEFYPPPWRLELCRNGPHFIVSSDPIFLQLHRGGNLFYLYIAQKHSLSKGTSFVAVAKASFRFHFSCRTHCQKYILYSRIVSLQYHIPFVFTKTFLDTLKEHVRLNKQSLKSLHF